MRFATWNVAHQAKAHRQLPESIGTALGALATDVLVLNEYVANDTHGPFLAALDRVGLKHVQRSGYVHGENQVLIASRYTLVPGNVMGPNITPATRPNWLHAHIPQLGVDVVGVRAPMFKVGKNRREYWDWFEKTVPTLTDAPTVLLGDLNTDPTRTRACGGAHLARLGAVGWKVVTPTSGWAFQGKTGNTSRIDHGIISPGCLASGAEYCTSCGGVNLAGAPRNGYSDHAVLMFDVAIPQTGAPRIPH